MPRQLVLTGLLVTHALASQGSDLTDEELIEHISEATTMSKGLEEYDGELGGLPSGGLRRSWGWA